MEIASGDNWFVNWADFPSVTAVTEDFWAAHWLVKRPGGTYAYDVAISLSHDGGESWDSPFTPHTDGTATEHGFVSMFRQDTNLGAVWLDGRNMESGHDHNHDHNHDDDGGGDLSGGMTIRAATITPAGTLKDELIIDDLVCECCQTDATLSNGNPVVIYRNRTAHEVRDIYISKFIEGKWTEGIPVANDNWEIAGCPVNGPAIAANQNQLAVAWFTLTDNEPKVRLAFAEHSSLNFNAPIDIDMDKPKGRVDVDMLNDNTTIVSWLRTAGNEAEFVIRKVDSNGQLGEITAIAKTSAERPSGFPQMVVIGDQLLFAWTRFNQDGSFVKTARLSTNVL